MLKPLNPVMDGAPATHAAYHAAMQSAPARKQVSYVMRRTCTECRKVQVTRMPGTGPEQAEEHTCWWCRASEAPDAHDEHARFVYDNL